MASYREGRPRRSIAWEHFEVKDQEKFIATCNHCNVTFSYRTSVSNLVKHLKKKHGYVKVSEEDGADNTDIEEGSDDKKIKNELWEYYEVKDEVSKLSICKLCNEQFSYQLSTSTMVKHLEAKHSITLQKDSDDDSEPENDADKDFSNGTEYRSRKKFSAAWEYFKIQDAQNKIAACIICKALCSYRSSVSNLLKHARRKHGLGNNVSKCDDDDEGHAGGDEEVDENETTSSLLTAISPMGHRSHRSIVWLYFKCIDPDSKLSQCLICKKVLSHSSTLTNLKKHLARKHPDVKIPEREDGRKRILLSSGGELYEVETNSKLGDDDDDDAQDQTIEMDTVFLDDFDASDSEPPAKKKCLPNTTNSRLPVEESSSEEELTFLNKYVKKKSDSLDHFGKYIVSLLRTLPQEVSNKLQSEFVKQIMAAQSNSDKSVDDKLLVTSFCDNVLEKESKI